MAQPARLDGLLVDPSREVTFTFEGAPVSGLDGDTIASALAANGQWMLSRSFKYRRPRGAFSMAGHDANTLVQLPDEPNVLADLYPISDGLAVSGQNYEGSLASDRGAWIGRFGRFMPPGFYYKAFFRPRGAWKLWEPFIRRKAGLGRVNPRARHEERDKAYAFAATVVIGGGPAGMSAALRAAADGGEVVLVDDHPVLGGALGFARFDAAGTRGRALREDLVAQVAATPAIDVWTNATAHAIYEDNWLAVVRDGQLIKLRARNVVVATGVIELPVVFRNCDLPGIMLCSAAQRLLRLYGVRPGDRAVVATANEHGYGAALDLAEAGVAVEAVCDLRAAPPDGEQRRAVRDLGITIHDGHTVWQATGRGHVEGVELAPITGEGECGRPTASVACDLVCLGAGYTPNAALLHHAGARFRYDTRAATHVLDSAPVNVEAYGSVAACYDLDGALTGDNGRSDDGLSHPWPMFAHPKGMEFLDLDEDLTIADIEATVAEGYDHIQLLKRFSTTGMGPSQGRLSNVAAIRLAARATGRPPDAVGSTTTRPPHGAPSFATLAGRSFQPVRRTPMHDRHLEAGAAMMVAGAWLRPAYYGPEAEAETLIAAEARAVRESVGLIDVSTLGKIEVRGPDAAAFLERIYTFAYAAQPSGRLRYVLMTDETGAIVDDGVACRLADDHFYVTATTGGVDAVHRTMLWWNAEWRLDVDIANVTGAYTAINIAGPRSRAVLAPLCDGVDLGGEAFPYLGVREGRVAGAPARLMRLGFVGELGYELHVPASQGEHVWDALIEAGRDGGIRRFGVEAQRLLRLEKGHIIVGQDTDTLTHPEEADMAWAISRRKPFFVGGRAIDMRTARGISRKLVGFRLADPTAEIPKECHLVIENGDIAGRVTSCARGVGTEGVIGLAYVRPHQATPGQAIEIRGDRAPPIAAVVVKLPFYDPDNQRQEP